MAYESRLFIVERKKFTNWNPRLGKDVDWVHGEYIADIKMSAMRNEEFYALFDKEIDYKLFIDNNEIDTDKDRYGEHLKYAKIGAVVAWLEEELTRSNYRRLQPLLGLLRGFDEREWNELQVVHYGY